MVLLRILQTNFCSTCKPKGVSESEGALGEGEGEGDGKCEGEGVGEGEEPNSGSEWQIGQCYVGERYST